MTNNCLPAATSHVVTNDFWLEYRIARAFTLNLGVGSMVAQDLKQQYYVKMSGVNGSTGVWDSLPEIHHVDVFVWFLSEVLETQILFRF